MATARGTIDLGDIPSEDFNADLELRVAAVYGDTILGSTTVKAQERGHVPFEVELEPVFNPGSIIPCGFRLIVGPNVGDRELLSLDVASTTYQFEKSRPKPRAKASKKKATAAAAECRRRPGRGA